MDVGFENPIFVALEADYGFSENPLAPVNSGIYQKQLNLYEMDLGINNLVLLKIIKVDKSAYKILSLHKKGDKPQFVLFHP